MRLSNDDLLDELHRLADEVGQTPTLTNLREQGAHSATTYYDRFGSWQEALKAAGFEPNEPDSEIPKEDLLDELHRLAADSGSPPSVTQMNRHGKYWASTYKRRFGSWNVAVEAAGFEPAPAPQDQPVSEDELLAELKRVAAECGAPPSYQEMEEDGKYGARTYIRHFGSWNEAVEAAGFEPHRNPQEVTEADLLAELHRLADELGERPTSTDIVEQGTYALATYQRHFGTWSTAVETAFET